MNEKRTVITINWKSTWNECVKNVLEIIHSESVNLLTFNS